MIRWFCVAMSILVACGGGDAAVPTVEPALQDSNMRLTSPAFDDGATIPVSHTCDAEDVSPPLVLDGIPDGTGGLVLLVEDPDAPSGTWDHWVAYDIDPSTRTIPEGEQVGVAGENSWGDRGYGGPCPPSGATHRYVFRVLALETPLGLAAGAAKSEVLEASRGQVLAEARLEGRYGR